MKTRAILIAIIVLIMSSVAGTAFAQDNTPVDDRPTPVRNFLSGYMDIITDATGLTAGELREQLVEGTTLAAVIEANGGDLDTVIAEMETRANEQIDTLLNTEFPLNDRADTLRDRVRNGIAGEIIGAVSDATGLEMVDITQALRDGATMTQIIENNEGDVDAVITNVISSVTDAVNERVESEQITQEQADMLLENLETTVTNWMNGEFDGQGLRGRRGNRR